MVAGETIPTIGELKGNTILELFKNGYNALKRALGFKQNKLIAGDNIVIDDDTNRISAIVGGEPVLDDYYTKSETNSLLDEKADTSDVYEKDDVYTKLETNSLLGEKANVEDVYSKSSIDSMMADKENIISAGDNIEITTDENHNKTIALKDNIVRTGTTQLTGNANITGNVTVTGNITQNGESYETHAEKIYTENDYIVTRDGAEGALASGDYSGIEVEKYDGTNNCRLVVDNLGVARVGDVGDEQPLLTRAESGNLTNGECLIWDATNQKAISEQRGIVNKLFLDNNVTSLPPNVQTIVSSKTVTDAGTYLLVGSYDVFFTGSGTELISAGFKVNDGSVVWTMNREILPNTHQRGTFARVIDLAANDIVRFIMSQNIPNTNPSVWAQTALIKLG